MSWSGSANTRMVSEMMNPGRNPDDPRIAEDGYVIGSRIPRSPSVAAAINKQLAEGFRQHALEQAFKDSSDQELIDELSRRGYASRKIR
jgi:hypothetical protein